MTQSCCNPTDVPPRDTNAALIVALAGNPNSGKTTIFNALTGLRQKVANYPGVTVEKKTGRCKLPDRSTAHIIDLPGTYSLISRAPDEQVAMEVLRGLRPDTPTPDVVIVVVDASNLQRNLYLVSQMIELQRPLVIALNMMDVAQRRGLNISAEKLQEQIGVPVIPIVGHKRRGIRQLKDAILNAKIPPMPEWPLGSAMHSELHALATELAQHAPQKTDASRLAIAERLLIGDRAKDLHQLADLPPIAACLDLSSKRLAALNIDPMQADIEAHYHWIDTVAGKSLAPTTDLLIAGKPTRKPLNLTERVDRILIHKVWGLLVFTLIMATIFVAIFWLAQPLMDAITAGMGWLGEHATAPLSDGPLKSLLKDGVFGGAGTVLVFLPQIALLFMFLAILEDTGYLARAAFLMDKLLARVGLHGKSFIPLLSSFACAIPGIMATRTIEDRRDRLATILIAPFMSCSARLPVYALLIGTLFGTYGALTQAGIMLGCYALGILAAVATAWFFKRSLLKGGATTFILELPTYKIPQASQVAREVWHNAGAFVTKAGTTILAFSIVLWALAYYPRISDAQEAAARTTAQTTIVAQHLDGHPAEEASDNAVAAAQSENSFAGRIGHAMEPAIRPLGFDWKMGIGLVGAFAARETFVSTMGITYAVGDTTDSTDSLAEKMQADTYSDGKKVWTPLVAISMLVWFVLALQCMSTVAIARRETGGWSWPIFMIVYMNALAYICSLAVYQIGIHLGYV